MSSALAGGFLSTVPAEVLRVSFNKVYVGLFSPPQNVASMERKARHLRFSKHFSVLHHGALEPGEDVTFVSPLP